MRLPRVLGLFDVSVLASAAMGPAYSLAATMGPMVAVAGGYATLALALLAAIMLCIAVAFSRLSRAMPNAGSSFSWIASAFGSGTGSYAAWLLLLSNYFATMTTALPAAAYTLDLFSPALATSPKWNAIVAALWIAASTLLLAFGLRPTALTTAVFLVTELVVVAASSVAALVVHPAPEHFAALSPRSLRSTSRKPMPLRAGSQSAASSSASRSRCGAAGACDPRRLSFCVRNRRRSSGATHLSSSSRLYRAVDDLYAAAL